MLRKILIAPPLVLAFSGCSAAPTATEPVTVSGKAVTVTEVETLTNTVPERGIFAPPRVKVYVARCGGRPVHKPSTIEVGEGAKLTRIRWLSYGGIRAVGTGVRRNRRVTFELHRLDEVRRRAAYLYLSFRNENRRPPHILALC